MFYLPPLRRLLLPALLLLTIIIFCRSKLLVPSTFNSFVIHPPPPLQEGIHVPITDPLPATDFSNNNISPPKEYFYSHAVGSKTSNKTRKLLLFQPILDPALQILFKCPLSPNKYTGHIRLPNVIRNISEIPPQSTKPENRGFWNPTIISLPYWSENQYLLISRILTDGNYQQNVLCEANICYPRSSKHARPGEKPCMADELQLLGPSGGMRCATAPVILSVPPTPAENCEGKYRGYVDIPGFHDPRVFWSGKGEPLMMVNTQYVAFSFSLGEWRLTSRCQIPLRLLRPLDH